MLKIRDLFHISLLSLLLFVSTTHAQDSHSNPVLDQNQTIAEINDSAHKKVLKCDVPPCVENGAIPPECKKEFKDRDEPAYIGCLQKICRGSYCSLYQQCREKAPGNCPADGIYNSAGPKAFGEDSQDPKNAEPHPTKTDAPDKAANISEQLH